MTDQENIAHLRAQVTELQAKGTALVTENRALRAEVARRRAEDGAKAIPNRRADVTAFSAEVCGREIPIGPVVPADESVRLALRLIGEEFFETLAACVHEAGYIDSRDVQRLWLGTKDIIDTVDIAVDLPAFADGLADIDYTVEHARVMFGIDGDPIWREVQRANMAKKDGPIVDGKKRKPANWTPPDIAGELRKQGWAP